MRPGVASQGSPMPPRRVALVGLGAISRFYLAALAASPAWELAAVCDVAEDRLAPWRKHVACFTDQPTILRELAGTLDAAVIAAPNDTHAELAAEALHAGLSVCVEKPLARTVAEGRYVTGAAREADRCLFTAFHRRYNSAVLELARAVAGRPVGSVHVRYLERIEEHMLGDRWYLDPARCGGGCVADNGPNAFDLVRLVLGEGELAVCGAEIGRDATGLDRTALIRLDGEGASGKVAVRVELDWSYAGEIKDLTVELADGRRLGADMLAGHHGFKQSLWHEYEGILAAFAHAIDTRATGQPVGDGGLAALELVQRTYATAASAPGVVVEGDDRVGASAG